MGSFPYYKIKKLPSVALFKVPSSLLSFYYEKDADFIVSLIFIRRHLLRLYSVEWLDD